MTAGIRPIIDSAVASVLAEHPKYFTPKGREHAQTVLTRKIMAAIRGDGADKASPENSPAPSAPIPLSIEPTSREGRAYIALRNLAGAGDPFRMSGGMISLPPEANNVRVMVLADLPQRHEWKFLTPPKQIGAWNEFFREMLPDGTPRRSIIETRGEQTGIFMPWPWPPGRDGRIYSTETEGDIISEAAELAADGASS